MSRIYSMKRVVIPITFCVVFLFSCGSDAPPISLEETASPPAVLLEPPSPTPAAPSSPLPPPPTSNSEVVEEVFDPSSITQEDYDQAKNEIQDLIQSLNTLVRARNYNRWVNYLTDSYLKTISSPGYLEDKSNDLYKKNMNDAAKNGRDLSRVRKIQLKNARDYFLYVVVPSHANDRVEDIEFMSKSRVKAYTLDDKNTRLVLYNLEHIDGQWLIAN